MGRSVSNGYTLTMKESGLRIRVGRELREQFLELRREQDQPASQVLREFMREYLERHIHDLKRNMRRGSKS